MYALRVDMSVAMVCMINQTALDEQRALATGVAINGANVTKVVETLVVKEDEDGMCARDSDGAGGNSTLKGDRVSGVHKSYTI